MSTSTATKVLASSHRFAFRAQQERNRKLRRMLLIVASVLVLALLAGLSYYGPIFVVRSIEVRGATPAVADQLTRSVVGILGKPLAQLDPASISRDLKLPQTVAQVQVKRSWPSTLRLQVRMRTAIAAIPSGRRFQLVDNTGAAYSTVSSIPAGLALINVTPGAAGLPALTAALTILNGLPVSLRPKVKQISASTADNVRMELGTAQIIWGNDQQLQLKVQVLQALLPQKAKVYDISAPSTPVIQ